MTQKAGIPSTARERGKIAPAKFAHVVLRTSRYAKMVDWYKSVLEAEPMFANDMATFLTYDDEHHRVAIAHMPGLLPRPKFMASVDHIAYTYECLGDLLHTYKRLKAAGIEPIWCINHGGTTSMYYADPDNNQIELQIDNFETKEEANAFLAGPDFVTNPIGIDFDPDELCARLDAGESPRELVRWKDVAPRSPTTIPRAYLGWFQHLLIRIASSVGATP